MLVMLVTMILCGLGVTRYLRNRKNEVQFSTEGVQTEFSNSSANTREPPSGSDFVTLG